MPGKVMLGTLAGRPSLRGQSPPTLAGVNGNVSRATLARKSWIRCEEKKCVSVRLKLRLLKLSFRTRSKGSGKIPGCSSRAVAGGRAVIVFVAGDDVSERKGIEWREAVVDLGRRLLGSLFSAKIGQKVI